MSSEQHYHEMEEEVSTKMQDALSDVQRAQARVQSVEARTEPLTEPLTIPRPGEMSSMVDASPEFFEPPTYLPPSMAQAPPPPTNTMPLGSIGQTMIMNPPVTSLGTSGTFGGTANFGSQHFIGAIPSTLPLASMGAVPSTLLPAAMRMDAAPMTVLPSIGRGAEPVTLLRNHLEEF